MKHMSAFLFSLLLVMPLAALAQDDNESVIREAMAKLVPGKQPDAIAPGPMDGFYEVIYGTHLFYVSEDGRFVVSGEVIDLREQVNLTEQRRSGARLDAMEKVDASSMIAFEAEEPSHTVTVFTDIDCPYCRRLHDEIDEYNARGITIRYLAFPRSGPGTPSYKKAVSVWCADDRRRAMTEAKSGGEPEEVTCEDNPVERHLTLGSALGVNGTPALVLDNGQMLNGFVPPDRLIGILEK